MCGLFVAFAAVTETVAVYTPAASVPVCAASVSVSDSGAPESVAVSHPLAPVP